MCDVSSIAVFCSGSIECFPGAASKFFLKLLVVVVIIIIFIEKLEEVCSMCWSIASEILTARLRLHKVEGKSQ